MKKILLLVLIVSSMLFSAIRNQIPLPASQLSTDNNGSKSAIEAYRDGVGIYTVKAQGNDDLDNKEMNSLVFKYGEAAGKSNTDLKEYVLEHGDSSEKESASKLGKFEPFVPLAGSSCDDNNIKTINDRYVNGVCVGVDVEGKFCNDNNAQTINDIYVNGICIGINVEGNTCNDNNDQTINDKYKDGTCEGLNVEGSTCDDNNIQTINDKYMNGVCFGLDVEGLPCDDSNVETINDKYADGICVGINVEGQSCNDGNSQTINDKYTNGVCFGINVEGQTCNDNNVQTINDKYVNGVCVGTNVEGQTCNDNNAKTINDKYTNGICAGTNVEGQTCNDNNVQTINDKYVNGVCVGTNVEGQSCPNNDLTINNSYKNGICTGKFFVKNEKWSDNSKANTCWEYYNGNANYQGSSANAYYDLKDGRRAYCNMSALVKIKTNNDWTGLVSYSSGRCYYNGDSSTQTLVNAGLSGQIFPHPTNDSKIWCVASLKSMGMFKTITIEPKNITPNTGTNGLLWAISHSPSAELSGHLPGGNTSAGNKIINGSGEILIKTNPGANNDHGADHSIFYIKGYQE